MPSATVNTSAENFAKIIAALDAKMEREDGETDAQLWRRDLKGYYTVMVFKDQRRVAQSTVSPDLDIVDIT